LLLKSQPVLALTDQVRLRSFTAKKVVVKANEINDISLNQLLNATSAQQISGTKVFQNLKDGNLTVAETLNNAPQKFLEPKNAEKTLELADGFEFQCDINVKNLVVKSVNGFNVSAVMKNFLLAGKRNKIRENLILQNTVSVDNLAEKSLMKVPVENLMTVSTKQNIAASVENLSENIANIIDGNKKEFL
jgi:hypothetical protein